MATHDDMLSNELPPPAYQLTDTELDRKIADAAQRSLTLQAEQLQRPTLPPLDEDGFPVWSEDLFNYNQALRQQEVEAASAKLQSEYVRVPASGTSGASTSSPPPPSRTRPISDALNSKQKEGNFGWLEGSSQRIAQDDDGQGGLNIGRPPYSPPPQTQNLAHSRPGIQVQVGPRPHDVLAQPQSPVSDPDEDLPVPTPAAAPSGALGRAPTYYPMGQNHPGARLRRNDTRASVDSTRSELPAWTAEAPSLEGPAYEEVEGGRGMSASPEGRRPPRPVQVQARPQIQERVAGARRSMTGASAAVPYASVSAPPAPPPVPSVPPASRHATSPPRSAPPAAAHGHRPPPIHAQTAPTTSYTPSGYAPPGATRPNAAVFDPGQAYRSNQRYNLSGSVDPISPSAFLEVQNAIREGGAGVFYNAAVAATMKGSGTAFVAPPPPPPRFSVPDDDGASVFSGMSGGSYGGTAKMSVHSGDKRSSYVPPAGGQGYQGFQAGQAQGFQGQQGFQGGQQGFQGGQAQGFQGGQAQGFQGQAQGGQGQGSLGQGFQQLNPAYQPTGAGYQPSNGQGYMPSNPARMSVLPPPPSGAYNPAANHAGGPSRPLPSAPGFVPPPGNAGGFAPAPPNAGGFVHPPPPGAAPAQPAPVGPGGFMVGRKPAKLYKRL